MTNKLKEEFYEWHDKKHARTGYLPASWEILDWWLSKLASQIEEIRGKLEGIKYRKPRSDNAYVYNVGVSDALFILQEMEEGK